MRIRAGILLLILALVPGIALAQDSSITGGVSDGTGAVLPGVTVEVSSPVMIEGSRVAVTDGQGRFAVTTLRPGTYSVSFTLPGFSTVVTDGVELPAAFTATVNAELSVGAIEETITVSGSAPTIDVQQVRERQVVSKEVLDTLPMGKDWGAIGALTVGVAAASQDVGGVREGYMPYLNSHGGDSRDGMRMMDGMSMGNLSCGYSCTTLNSNDANTQELSYEVGAVSADVAIGGVRVNIIPKEGGNTFSGSAFANWSNSSLQGDNLTPALKAQGVQSPDVLDLIYDTSYDLGGPLVQDKLWFHAAFRAWGLQFLPSNTFYDTDPNPFVFTPGTEKGVDANYNASTSLRLTAQATEQNKFSVYFNHAFRHLPNTSVSSITTPQASRDQRNPLNYHGTATWTGTISSRVLLEAGFGGQVQDATVDPQDGFENVSHHRELSTGLRFGGSGIIRRWLEINRSYKASLSYVTGSHSMKFGMNLNEGNWRQGSLNTGPSDSWNFYYFGRPFMIVPFATPFTVAVDLNHDLGLYAQDTWTLGQTTLNLGVRWDYVRQSIPEQDTSIFVDQPPGSNAPGTWSPRRIFAPIPDAANWKDISPRFGIAHDVFGDGRTAIKGSLSRYLRVDTIAMGASRNPVNTTVISSTRRWSDANGDGYPDESELGPLANQNFGTENVTNFFDADVHSGFGNRRGNWEMSFGVEHEIAPRTSLDISFWRRVNDGFSITDNQLVSPSDFDEYCVTAPTDAKLPGGGGNQICGLYDVSPAKFGQVRNQVQLADGVGAEMTQVYNGIDISVNSRITSNLFFYGGVSTGRSAFNDCNARLDSPSVSPRVVVQEGGSGSAGGWDYDEDSNPDTLLPVGHHCAVSPPFWNPAWKLNGAYTLPGDVQVSAALQNLPGTPITALWTVSDADVTGLGRPLSGGSAEVHLVEPGTMYADRLNQLDIRVTKILDMNGGQRFKIMFDAYNMFNNSAPLGLNTTYGPQWTRPTSILLARFVKFGAQFQF